MSGNFHALLSYMERRDDFLVTVARTDGADRYGFDADTFGSLNQDTIEVAGVVYIIKECSCDSTLTPSNSGFIFEISGAVTASFFQRIAIERSDGVFFSFETASVALFSTGAGRSNWLWNMPAVIWAPADVAAIRKVSIFMTT